MINIIFTIKKTVAEWLLVVWEEENTFLSLINKLWATWVWQPIECREYNEKIVVQADVPNLTVFNTIKTMLEQLDQPEVIWIWNSENWLQYGFKYIYDIDGVPTVVRELDELWEPVVIDYPFNSNLYLEHQADEVACDELGYELSRERPEELKQINKFGGKKDRDLNIYL